MLCLLLVSGLALLLGLQAVEDVVHALPTRDVLGRLTLDLWGLDRRLRCRHPSALYRRLPAYVG